MSNLTFGVLGAAKIARTHMIPALQLAAGCQYWGVASRNLQKANDFAALVGGGAIEGYEALLNNPNVDVIYNALPNDLHVSYCIKALEAGKHVLCEKPLALNAQDAKALLAASAKHPHLQVMEAFMYRFHPQWQQVLEWISQGEIGAVKNITSQFCYNNHDPANIRNNPAAGGGALMDVGCYGISLARMVLGREPSRVVAISDMHPEYQVDNMTQLTMDFKGGAVATVMVNTKTQRSQMAAIEGSKGRIVLTHPFYCDPDDERTVRLETDGEECEMTFGSNINHYQLMLEAFAQSIQHQLPTPLPLHDSIANMAVIDAAFASIANECWMPVAHYA